MMWRTKTDFWRERGEKKGEEKNEIKKKNVSGALSVATLVSAGKPAKYEKNQRG